MAWTHYIQGVECQGYQKVPSEGRLLSFPN
uniref:Uncharacterized protein n=1 Tax=Anguilla anguilla TaxID=7936 RepID=A0A0E9R8D5_ANGAN